MSKNIANIGSDDVNVQKMWLEIYTEICKGLYQGGGKHSKKDVHEIATFHANRAIETLNDEAPRLDDFTV